MALRSRGVIVAVALAGDILIALMKFGAAYATGSSAMSAEGIHSVMDAATEVALLYGIVAAHRPATALHQLGFGREIFFWGFVAALLIFAAGSGSALHDGVSQIMNPQPIRDIKISYCVLFVAFLVELACTAYALNRVAGVKTWSGVVRFVRATRDTASLTILLGGLAGVMGLILAATGIGLGVILDQPSFDGFASIGIAVILALTASFLAAQGKSLLIGKSASAAKVNAIKEVAAAIVGVRSINGAVTVQLSPDQILVALSVAFAPELLTSEIENIVAAIDVAIKADHPEITTFLVKPQSRQLYAKLSASRGW
nr:cation diffusion facilitator family transporter [Bradyrhizobium sp. 48]